MNNLIIFVLLTSASFHPTIVSAVSSELQLIDGRYRKLLVFLEEESFAERPIEHYVQQLQSLKTGFEQTSNVISTLTAGVGHRWNFGDVTVLVSARLGRRLAQATSSSDTWLNPQPASWQRRDRADFFVTPDVTIRNEGPVSVVAACGQPGLRVILAAESLAPEISDLLGRRLALYFSQYRWGLLSEAPIRNNLLQTVVTPGRKPQYRAASCSPTLSSEFRIAGGSRDGQRCDLNLETKEFSANCSIVVTESPESQAASFLFSPYSAGVARFCDSPVMVASSNPKLVHNRGADNLLNRHCGQLSAAEIVRLHSDYKQAGLSTGTAKVDFQLVAETDRRRVVVVMDTSGSMGTDNRITNMIGAVNLFLTEVLENGSECALISFNEKATVLQNFFVLDSPAARQHLVQLVSHLSAHGGTCIGAAVMEAMKLLGVQPGQPNRRSTGQIILLSDGQEGCSQELDLVMGALSNTSLEVVSIRYGDQADPRMSRLAEVTGGRQFFGEAAGTGSAGGLAAASLRLSLGSTTAGLSASDRTITLVTQEIQPDFQGRLEISIDASIRRDLAFALSFPAQPNLASSLRVSVRSPSGRRFNCTGGNNAVCSVDSASGTLSIRIPDAGIEVGRWTIENLTVRIKRELHVRRRWRRNTSAVNSGLIVVTGKPATGGSATKQELPTALSGFVLPSKVQLVTETTRIGVYARLLQGYSPVLSARVFAAVRSNEGLVARFNLTDNGAGADLLANDGTYSGLVPAEAVLTARDYSVSVISTHPISRVTSAGKLTIVASSRQFDRRQTPPGRIVDLSLNVNLSKNTALLSWTPVEDPSGLLAPGDVVPVYTIRYAMSSEYLLVNFSSSMELLTSSESSPNIFSHVASLGVGQVYLAVAGVSASNITGSVSNVIAMDDPTLKPSADELKVLGINVIGPASEDDDRGPRNSQKAPVVVLSVMAILVAAGMLVGGFFLVRQLRVRSSNNV